MTIDTGLTAFDQTHLWHPYSVLPAPRYTYPVVSAEGVCLQLADGRMLIDGMSSWWAAIHGYNHPQLNAALIEQSQQMAHVMFGGLTHPPAVELGKRLLRILPPQLDRIFFCDSGSVAVEVAIKMAMQYWFTHGQSQRTKLLTVRHGYHGDTLAAMSVSDPENSMHHLFMFQLSRQIFAQAPPCHGCFDAAVNDMRNKLVKHRHEIIAVIIEPVVQGAGGMRIYDPQYLIHLRQLCDEFGVLLIFDEIATGFGRTGRMFACEHAAVVPDIMCIGKALSAGYMTLAATVTSELIAEQICDHATQPFMHGPTYMANPLACAVARQNIDLLSGGAWRKQVQSIEVQLQNELADCRHHPAVKAVRVKGAIGVVETHVPVNVEILCDYFVRIGVWIRPFRNLLYLMPPYIIQAGQLTRLTEAIYRAVSLHYKKLPGALAPGEL